MLKRLQRAAIEQIRTVNRTLTTTIEEAEEITNSNGLGLGVLNVTKNN